MWDFLRSVAKQTICNCFDGRSPDCPRHLRPLNYRHHYVDTYVNHKGVVTVCPGPEANRKSKNITPLTDRKKKFRMGVLGDMAPEIHVVFVTERILVLHFPSKDHEHSYKQSLKEVSRMLRTKHGNQYKVFNVSKRRNDLSKLNPHVLELGWPDDLAPPLERLCSICKEIETWLSSNPAHIIVFHCKGGINRAVVVIAAYMQYTNICASDDQALDRFAMRRFYDEYSNSLVHPSQIRYVTYFSGLLSGAIKINSCPIYLHQVTIYGLPKIDAKNMCCPFIKVYESMVPVYTSGVYSPADGETLVVLMTGPVQLRGDVLVKCYHHKKSMMTSAREVIFRCQFNTCALPFNESQHTKTVIFKRNELDDACRDAKFSDSGKVELLFSLNPDDMKNGHGHSVNSPLPEAIVRSDSYEDFGSGVEDNDTNATDDCTALVSTELKSDKKVDNLCSSESTSFVSSSVNASNVENITDISSPEEQIVQKIVPNENLQSKPTSSADSGISTASQKKFVYNCEVCDDYAVINKSRPSTKQNTQIEEPIVKKEAKKDVKMLPNQSQFAKLFGKYDEKLNSNPEEFSEEKPLVTKRVKHQQESSDVIMEASVRANSPPASPKPVTGSNNNDVSPKFLHQPPPVMPPTKRPSSPSLSSMTGGPYQEPSLIDRELVGEDRYDPASKAFSYVPNQALMEHFNAPKKQTRLVQEINGVEVNGHLEDRIRNFNHDYFQDPMDPVQSQEYRYPVPHDPIASQMSKSSPAIHSRSLNLGREMDVDPVELPSNIGGPKRATFVRHRSVDEMSDIHQPDIDLLLDPSYYLSFNSSNSTLGDRKLPVSSPLTSTTYTSPVTVSRPTTMARDPQVPADLSTYMYMPPVPPPPQRYEPSPSPHHMYLSEDFSDSSPMPYDMGPTPPLVPPEPHYSEPYYGSHGYMAAMPPKPSGNSPMLPPSSDLFMRPPTAPPGEGPYYCEDFNPQMYSQGTAVSAAMIYNSPPPVASRNLTLPTRSHYQAPKGHHSDWSLIDALGPSYNKPEGSVRSTQSAQQPSNQQMQRYGSMRGRTLSDMEPDDWLEMQLSRLKLKKEYDDPILQQKKFHERRLLDELKNIHDEGQTRRSRRESEYSVEGVGSRSEDALEQLKLEHTRLMAAKSPIDAALENSILSRSTPTDTPEIPRSTGRTTPQTNGRSSKDPYSERHGIVTRKPPTPPPKERSRTPPSPRRGPSPQSTSTISPPTKEEQPKQTTESPDQRKTEPVNDFSYLESYLLDADDPNIRGTPVAEVRKKKDTVEFAEPNQIISVTRRNESESPRPILKRPKEEARLGKQDDVQNVNAVNGNFEKPDNRITTPVQFMTSQSTSNSPMMSYDNRKPPMVQRTPSNSHLENDPNRPQTPAFPVKRTETPVPFHPLLYQGAVVDPKKESRSPAPIRPSARSPSPGGSVYYGQSRRSSVTSAGIDFVATVPHRRSPV